MFIRRGLDKCVLAQKFFGSTNDAAMKRLNSIIRTWVCAIGTILRTEERWIYPEHADKVNSTAFSQDVGKDVLSTADCTNFNCEGSTMSPLIGQQLHSVYYEHTCGKYCVGTSKIGGTTLCGPGQGGPASDHQCMVAAVLFEERNGITESHAGLAC